MTFNYMLGTLICARHATMRSTYKYVLDTGACAQPANLLDTRIVCARRTKRPTHKNAFDKQICARHTNMPSANTKVCSALKRVLDKATDGPASVHLGVHIALGLQCIYVSLYMLYNHARERKPKRQQHIYVFRVHWSAYVLRAHKVLLG